MGCSAEQVAAALRAAAGVIAEHRDELVQLDRAIGDGDHGENLKRGFTAIVSKLDGSVPDTPAGVLKLAATTLISTVGGAAGPLYGTAFLRAATATADSAELSAESVSAALRAALEGVVARGKAVAAGVLGAHVGSQRLPQIGADQDPGQVWARQVAQWFANVLAKRHGD